MWKLIVIISFITCTSILSRFLSVLQKVIINLQKHAFLRLIEGLFSYLSEFVSHWQSKVSEKILVIVFGYRQVLKQGWKGVEIPHTKHKVCNNLQIFCFFSNIWYTQTSVRMNKTVTSKSALYIGLKKRKVFKNWKENNFWGQKIII